MKRLRFADTTLKSLEKVQTPIDTPPGVSYIFVRLGVVSADVPDILDLDVLKKKLLTAGNVSNILVKKELVNMEGGDNNMNDVWNLPLTGADGYVYTEINSA